jgi:hypothetical protein
MSQNGPYPGQSWSAGGSDEPYTEPADPWRDAGPPPEPAWGAHPTSMPPAIDSSVGYEQGFEAAPTVYEPGLPHPAAPSWNQPPQQPIRRNTPIIALVVVLTLLILGGLGTTAWLLNHPRKPTGNSVLPSGQSTATGAVVEPEPQNSQAARFVTKGQCVRNENTPESPVMTIVPCASGTFETFEVLRRFDGRTTGEADAESKCSKVPAYTKWYFYDSPLDSLDFVLCLREHRK